MSRMSLRAYSRHRKCALYSVQKAIASGRISKGDDGLIDSDAADLAWVANTNVAKAPPAERLEPPAAGPPLLTGEVLPAPSALSARPDWSDMPEWTPPAAGEAAAASKVVNGDSFMAARTRLAWMEVAEREAELATARGETVGAEEARKAFRDIGRIYGRARAAAASEIAPQVIGLTDPNEVERRIKQGLLAIDERIANEIATQFTAYVERSSTGS